IGSSLAIGALLFAEPVPQPQPGVQNEGDRFLGYVSTDKPIYRIGETLYLRTVVVGADDRKPLAGNYPGAMVEITGPKGETIARGYAGIADSVAAFSWQVPEGSAGGLYAAKVSFPQMGFPPA